MKTKPHRRGCRGLILTIGGLLGLCLVLSSISALGNRNLPQADTADRIAPLDKARLAEAIHLRASLGDGIWPGFGEAQIPILLSNAAYEFLVKYPGRPPVEWNAVAGDSFLNGTYYRRPAGDSQNFAVPVGDGWAAGMATKSKTDAFLIETFRGMFPPPIKQVFPYRVLIQPSETQIGAVLHEEFHVFQIYSAKERLEASEAAHRLGDRYEAMAGDFAAEWKRECGLLADALAAKTTDEKRELVKQFLAARDTRRSQYKMEAQLIDYERWLEWEEGTAKYVEVLSLKLASASAYAPVPDMQDDLDFKGYRTFNQRWANEMFQLRQQSSPGEGRFYTAGMAQAFLLDDLLPGWKEQYWLEGVFLEDLLRQGVGAK
jgi:hypothetical protein